MIDCFGVKSKLPFKCIFGYFKILLMCKMQNTLHWNYFANFTNTIKNKTMEVV